jgi:hypothetical protein
VALQVDCERGVRRCVLMCAHVLLTGAFAAGNHRLFWNEQGLRNFVRILGLQELKPAADCLHTCCSPPQLGPLLAHCQTPAHSGVRHIQRAWIIASDASLGGRMNGLKGKHVEDSPSGMANANFEPRTSNPEPESVPHEMSEPGSKVHSYLLLSKRTWK